MVATTMNTHNDVASTIAALEVELPQLEEHQLELEKNLAAVTERLAAVRVALTSLKALNSAPAPLLESAAVQPEEDLDAAPAAQAQPTAAKEETPDSTSRPVPAPRRSGDTKARRGAKTPKATAGRKKTTATTPAEQHEDRPTRNTGAGKKPKAAPAPAPTQAAPAAKRTRTQGLSQSIVAVLAKANNPLRAGEVNDILGREKTNGSVNSVRTALERLVVNQDIQRVGRGLYEALPA